jgi:Bacterial PH domain
MAAVSDDKSVAEREVFRSPAAVVIWWVWVLFAVGNLVDLAVQGRDHLSLVAAFILLFITGVMYVTALRPRVIADAAGMTIVNPFGDRRVGWAAVSAAEATELLRVRCEWPDGDRTARRAIYAWAVHSSRRRQVSAEIRAQRQQRRGNRGIGGSGLGRSGLGGFGGYGEPPGKAPEPVPLGVDADRLVATITARAEQARLDAPGTVAAAPVSNWNWPAIAAVAVPGIALLIAALA